MNLEERIAQWFDVGRIDYQEAYQLQERLVDLRKNKKIVDTILICEHPPQVDFSISGKNSKFSDEFLIELNGRDPEEVLNEKGIKFTKTSRGGGAAYIGPGQLVVYPIVDHTEITHRKIDESVYKEKIDEIMFDVLRSYNLPVEIVRVVRELEENNGELRKDRKDVWIKKDGTNYKIGGKGVKMAWPIAYHGFSIYVTQEGIKGFNLIDACGYPKNILDTTSMEGELGIKPDIKEVRDRTLEAIKKHFEYNGLIQLKRLEYANS